MNKGFFSISKLQNKQPESHITKCGLCGLYKNCISPKMPPTGEGRKKILIVAEAPGEEEDKRNTQLIGRAGKYTRRVLKTLNIDLDIDCWKTNAVICRREGNATPEDYMIQACRPNLMKTIRKYDPNVVILLGAVACKSLLSKIWKEEVGSISRWGGYIIPCLKPNTWIVPTYHPSYLLRKNDEVLNKIFKQHIRAGIKKRKSKPWTSIPDYKKEIEVIVRPSRAAKILKEITKRGGVISFDYETNCLKPEYEGSEIVSCSVCWQGKKTISYPWHGEAIDETINLLRSLIYKIGANIKFEDRWTRAKLGFNIKKWYWDTMIASHVINNCPGITNLTFQGFVLLGVEPYDECVKPYLKASGKNHLNRIYEINLRDLLLYGGMDSNVTYKVAMKQINILGKKK